MTASLELQLSRERLAHLTDFLRQCRAVVLAGAGCSTESGIPDYRGPSARVRRAPMQYREFVSSEAARRRYWARSLHGWPSFAAARPNPTHVALAELEAGGRVGGVITQNVDRLHHKAGSRTVIELHGALTDVRCLGCGALEARGDFQERLLAHNPQMKYLKPELLPDGDAELDASLSAAFDVPSCLNCHGVLKPDVVFFGENVPRPRVDAAWQLLNEADVLLVVGSSLTVFSGFRFVREAARRGMPVAIVNLGATRGDELAALKIEARLGDCMPKLAQALLA